MPEHIKTLVVILVLSTVVFAFAHQSACAISGTGNFTRRRNLWFAITLAAFLAHNFWLYTLIALLLLIYANLRETNPPALFFFILFAVPMATIAIPGMGLINIFFNLSHARILELFLLLPAFFVLVRQRGTLTFGRTWPDRLLAAYILLNIVLYLRETSITDTLRQAFYMFIDVFLPYFVISRSLKSLQIFRDTLLSLVAPIMVIALLAIFETSKHWLLYHPLLAVLGLEGGSIYFSRDGALRAVVTAGHSIALGYLIAVGMGIFLFLQRFIRQKFIRYLGLALLTVGLIAPLSRGPWLGAAVLVTVFIATGRNAVIRLMRLVPAAILALALIAILPGGEKLINLLPFVGTVEQGSIDYRATLLSHSIIVIERSPWFGSVNYLSTPEMESLRTGLGIIDIVNTYIQVALETGFVGLGLFVGFFTMTILGVYRAMRSIPDKDSDEHLLGRALFATLLAIVIMIFTVSSITIIPIVYWSVAALGAAYMQMVRRLPASKPAKKDEAGSRKLKYVQVGRNQAAEKQVQGGTPR